MGANQNMVQITISDGSGISIPATSLLKEGTAGSFYFGQGEFEATITVVNPTPAEALFASPPQRKASRALRDQIRRDEAQSKEATESLKSKKRVLETPKSESDTAIPAKRSVFSRLSFKNDRSEGQRHLPPLQPADQTKAKQSSGLSRRARRNINRRLYKPSQVRRVETPVQVSNAFSPLSKLEEESAKTVDRMVTSSKRKEVPIREDRRALKPRKEENITLHQELERILSQIHRQGLNPHTQQLAKEAVEAVCGYKPQRMPRHSIPERTSDHQPFSGRIQQESHFRPEQSARRFEMGQSSRSDSSYRKVSRKDDGSLLITKKMSEPTRFQKGNTVQNKYSMQWVAKAPQIAVTGKAPFRKEASPKVYEKQTGKAPKMGMALPSTKMDKGKALEIQEALPKKVSSMVVRSAPSSSDKGTSTLSKVEFRELIENYKQQILDEGNFTEEEDEQSRYPTASIHTTTRSTRPPRPVPDIEGEPLVEEEEVETFSNQSELVQLLNEKTSRITLLEAKLEEALKAVNQLVAQGKLQQSSQVEDHLEETPPVVTTSEAPRSSTGPPKPVAVVSAT